MAESNTVKWLRTDSLRLDRRNPRLVEYGVTGKTPERELVEMLWDTMDVQELVQSIAASGYFAHEPLIVAQEGGHNIVIEGNRRLAAVRVLLDDELAADLNCSTRIHDPRSIAALRTLPAIMSDRKSSWRHLGFKHVNGPAKWSSYAKAQYIAGIHRTYGVPLDAIAEQIGDRHKTVPRLYRGLLIIELAEDKPAFSRDDRYRKRFAFSHLYTGLDYDGIRAFLSLESADAEKPRPVPKNAVGRLGELCLWLYGSRKQDLQPVVRSQNPDLRTLDSVLANKESLAALRDGVPLDNALQFGREPAAILDEVLRRAKRDLISASGQLTIGYDGSRDLLRVAGEICELAEDICRDRKSVV